MSSANRQRWALWAAFAVIYLVWGSTFLGIRFAVETLPPLAILGAAVSWSVGAVLSQRLELPADPVLRAAMQMACGGVLLAAASALRGELHDLHAAAFSARSLAALGYLIAFGSVLAFACY